MRGHGADVARASSIPGPIGITDRGVILGRSVLVRTAAGASRPLALDADRDRLFALLSVVAERPVGAEVLRPIEAAAAHWRRGDKAVANLRLVFSGLPRLAGPAAAARLSLAEQVLDGGMAPDAMMKALWPQPDPNALDKYNPDQPRVPAGNGVESGRWEFGDDGAAAARRDRDGRIVVAADEKPPPLKELPYQERHSSTRSVRVSILRPWRANIGMRLTPRRRSPSCWRVRGTPRWRAPVDEAVPAYAKLDMSNSWQKQLFEDTRDFRDVLRADPDEAQRQLAAWEDYTIDKLGLERYR